MKSLLFALVFLFVNLVVHADTDTSSPPSLKSSLSDYIAFLENKDGTVTPAYYDPSGRSLILYRWNSIEINPKDIPNFNTPNYGGLNFNPIGRPTSTPYVEWSRMDVRHINPLKAYYWDVKDEGFRAGFPDRLRGLFYETGRRVYQKAQLPSKAQVVVVNTLVKIIPVVSASSKP